MQDRRDKITEAATHAVKRDGLRSVSFRQLADAVGVKSSSVHYHFPTKPDLANALVQDYTSQFAQQMATIKRTNSSLVDQLDALIDVFQGVVEDQSLCLCAMMAAELTSLDATTRSSLGTFFASVETWVSEAFEEHQEQIRMDLPHHQLARVFVSGLEGAMLLDRVEDSCARLGAFRAFARSLIT